MNQFIKGLFVAIALFASQVAMAHPGHGTFTGHEIMHYLTSPMHIGVATLLLVVVFAIAGKRLFKKAK